MVGANSNLPPSFLVKISPNSVARVVVVLLYLYRLYRKQENMHIIHKQKGIYFVYLLSIFSIGI